MNRIKLNKIRLKKKTKNTQNLFNLINKYIQNLFKQIHTCKVVGRRGEE